MSSKDLKGDLAKLRKESGALKKAKAAARKQKQRELLKKLLKLTLELEAKEGTLSPKLAKVRARLIKLGQRL